MKILFVGVFEPPESSHHGMVTAFKKAGHTVDIFDFRKEEKENRKFTSFERRLHLHLEKLQKPWLPSFLQTLIFRLPGIKRMNQLLLAQAAQGKYDLIFLVKTEKVHYKNIDKLNSFSETWYYFIDPMKIAKKIRTVEYAKRTAYSSATRENVSDLFNRAGGNSVFLTQGTDTDLFYPDPDAPKEYDAVFIGTMKPHRKTAVDTLKTKGINVTTFGKGCDNPPVFLKDLGDIYRKAKIILNLNSHPDSTGFSLRVFQALGTGSMVLSEYCIDMEKKFENKKDIVWFKNPDECADLVSYYLEHEDEREMIGKAGLEKTLSEYSWDRIIAHILKKVETE